MTAVVGWSLFPCWLFVHLSIDLLNPVLLLTGQLFDGQLFDRLTGQLFVAVVAVVVAVVAVVVVVVVVVVVAVVAVVAVHSSAEPWLF